MQPAPQTLLHTHRARAPPCCGQTGRPPCRRQPLPPPRPLRASWWLPPPRAPPPPLPSAAACAAWRPPCPPCRPGRRWRGGGGAHQGRVSGSGASHMVLLGNRRCLQIPLSPPSPAHPPCWRLLPPAPPQPSPAAAGTCGRPGGEREEGVKGGESSGHGHAASIMPRACQPAAQRSQQLRHAPRLLLGAPHERAQLVQLRGGAAGGGRGA